MNMGIWEKIKKKGRKEEGRWGKGRRTKRKLEEGKGEKGHESQPDGSRRLGRTYSRLC